MTKREDLLERHATQTEKQQGLDFADYLVGNKSLYIYKELIACW
jgi:hypothetical protein